MKVERKEKAFEPVVITLESQEELVAARSALHYAANDYDKPMGQLLHDMARKLDVF